MLTGLKARSTTLDRGPDKVRDTGCHSLRPPPDSSVIEIGEQQAVQLVDVRVQGLGGVAQNRRDDSLQLFLLRVGRAVADLDVLKSCGDEQERERVRVQRPDMRDVPDITLEKGKPARRIDGLQH